MLVFISNRCVRDSNRANVNTSNNEYIRLFKTSIILIVNGCCVFICNKLIIENVGALLYFCFLSYVFVLVGALKKSHLIDSHIIDHYVPFLPLEKVHVLQCIDAELKHNQKTLDSKAKK